MHLVDRTLVERVRNSEVAVELPENHGLSVGPGYRRGFDGLDAVFPEVHPDHRSVGEVELVLDDQLRIIYKSSDGGAASDLFRLTATWTETVALHVPVSFAGGGRGDRVTQHPSPQSQVVYESNGECFLAHRTHNLQKRYATKGIAQATIS